MILSKQKYYVMDTLTILKCSCCSFLVQLSPVDLFLGSPRRLANRCCVPSFNPSVIFAICDDDDDDVLFELSLLFRCKLIIRIKNMG